MISGGVWVVYLVTNLTWLQYVIILKSYFYDLSIWIDIYFHKNNMGTKVWSDSKVKYFQINSYISFYGMYTLQHSVNSLYFIPVGIYNISLKLPSIWGIACLYSTINNYFTSVALFRSGHFELTLIKPISANFKRVLQSIWDIYIC